MKELNYVKEVDSIKLMEEIYKAIPSLKPKFNKDGTIQVHLRVFTNGFNLILWVDEETNEKRLGKVVESHKAGEK